LKRVLNNFLIRIISISSNKYKKSAAQCVTTKHVDY
jgi:hypothetical protein